MPDGHFDPLPEGFSGPGLTRSGKFVDVEILGGLTVGGSITGGTITGGTITGTTISGGTIIAADLYSDNWNGTIPLALPDAGATLGYALDADTGIIQAQDIRAKGGTLTNLTIDGTLTMSGGSIYTNAASNYRLRLSSSGLQAYNTSNTLVNTLSIDSIGMNFSDRIYGYGITNLATGGDPFRIEDAFAGTYQGTHDSRFHIDTHFINISTVGGVGDTYDAYAGIFFDPDYTGYLGVSPVEFMRLTYSVDNSYGPSYSRSGPQVLLVSSTQSALPDLSFIGDQDTGMYRAAANIIGFTAGSVNTLRITSAGVVVGDDTISLTPYMRGAAAGTEAAPAYTFVDDSNTGIYNLGSDDIGLTVGASLALRVNATRVDVASTFLQLPVKTTTGDPASVAEGDTYVNTFDNKIRTYADAAWRDLATW